MFRVIRKLKYNVNKEKHTKYIPKHYDTPKDIGIKWQMKAYLKRSNNIPMQSLNWLTPLEMRHKLIQKKQ